MNGDNIMKFMKESSHHVSNINRALRNIKSNVLVNFIYSDLLGIMVVTCKVTSLSDLQVIKNYIKNVNCIDITEVDTSRLLQSKSYLKIIGISYFQYDSSNHLMLKDVEDMSGVVHTGVEVCRIDSEMSGLVEWPWLQLMCCAVCLPYGCNFRWRRESPSGSEYWLVCRCWTLEIKFNKRLSSSIIRLANYNVTTSLIYKWKV